MPRTRRTLVTWIACVAVLMASLAPSISQAFQRGVPSAWTEVCTAFGARLVSADGQIERQAPSSSKHLLAHCPYCSLHVTALGMPPAPIAMDSLVPLGFAVPELMLAAPRTLFAWATAQPRAPPQLS